MTRTALVLTALVLAATALQSLESEAGGRGREQNDVAYCNWFRQQAMNTGDEYWWFRYRSCVRGW
jgi:hypothetical protein